MKYWLGRFVLWLGGGWKMKDELPPDLKKCVLVAAPHTSNWDFVFGLAGLFVMKPKVRYLIKKEVWIWPFSEFLKWSGGIPVDRSKPNHLTDTLIEMLNNNEELFLLFPPEGTRSWVPKWKTGFYRVALDTELPLVLGYLDFKTKIGGYKEWFMPSGNKKEDFDRMEAYYADKTGKHPEKFNKQFYIRD
jgi:1-acyl-sn-glycerol-3-phosphate acyltransferase